MADSATRRTLNSSAFKYVQGTSFQSWKDEFERSLLTHKPTLLGFLKVEDYDGTQTFRYLGKNVPAVSTKEEEVEEEYEDSSGKKRKKKVKVKVPNPWDLLEQLSYSQTVMSHLKANIHQDFWSLMGTDNTVFDAYTKFCAFGENKRPGDYQQVNRKLNSFKLRYGMLPAAFPSELELRMKEVVEITGQPYTEVRKSLQLVECLPPSWDTQVAAWRGQDPYIPYDKLKELVEGMPPDSMDPKVDAPSDSEEKKPAAPSNTPKAALFVNKGDQHPSKRKHGKKPRNDRCFYCNSHGHTIGNCQSRVADEKRGCRRTKEESRRERQEIELKEQLEAKDRTIQKLKKLQTHSGSGQQTRQDTRSQGHSPNQRDTKERYSNYRSYRDSGRYDRRRSRSLSPKPRASYHVERRGRSHSRQRSQPRTRSRSRSRSKGRSANFASRDSRCDPFQPEKRHGSALFVSRSKPGHYGPPARPEQVEWERRGYMSSPGRQDRSKSDQHSDLPASQHWRGPWERETKVQKWSGEQIQKQKQWGKQQFDRYMQKPVLPSLKRFSEREQYHKQLTAYQASTSSVDQSTPSVKQSPEPPADAIRTPIGSELDEKEDQPPTSQPASTVSTASTTPTALTPTPQPSVDGPSESALSTDDGSSQSLTNDPITGGVYVDTAGAETVAQAAKENKRQAPEIPDSPQHNKKRRVSASPSPQPVTPKPEHPDAIRDRQLGIDRSKEAENSEKCVEFLKRR